MTSKTVDKDEKVAAAVERVRPLTAGQANKLEKLVHNDFQQLRIQIREAAEQKIAVKHREMKAEASEERAFAYKEEAEKLLRQFRQAQSDLIKVATANGFEITMTQLSFSVDNVMVTDKRLQQRMKDVQKAVYRERDAALAVLDRQFLIAQRKVLIASITSQVEEILLTVPTAEELMTEAMAELAKPKPGEIK